MSTKYRRVNGTSQRQIGDSLFLANAATGAMYRVNQTVAALWRLLEEPHSVEEAVRVFHDAFPNESLARVHEHVWTMVRDLIEEQMLEECE
jgi:hypothetical protein